MAKRRESLRGKGIGESISVAFAKLGLGKEEKKTSTEGEKTTPSSKKEKAGIETKLKEKKETPEAETKVAESVSEEKRVVSETSSQTEETKSGLEKKEVASEKKKPGVAKAEKAISKEKAVETGKAEPDYKSKTIKEPKSGTTRTDVEDRLFDCAKGLVISSGQASVSMLQSRLRIDYSRAARLIDMLKEKGELPEQN